MLSAEHRAGVRNEAADALSRNNVELFLQKIPTASTIPSEIPPDLIEVLLSQKHNWLSASWSSVFQACL